MTIAAIFQECVSSLPKTHWGTSQLGIQSSLPTFCQSLSYHNNNSHCCLSQYQVTTNFLIAITISLNLWFKEIKFLSCQFCYSSYLTLCSQYNFIFSLFRDSLALFRMLHFYHLWQVCFFVCCNLIVVSLQIIDAQDKLLCIVHPLSDLFITN